MESNHFDGGTFLQFYLGEDEYAVRILDVQEIIAPAPITPVPGTPESIRGVVNLRGKIVPVMDLRRKFGLVLKQDAEATCFVIIQYRHWLMGIVVDQVSDIRELSGVEGEPDRGNTEREIERFVSTVADRDEKTVRVLDVSKLITDEPYEEIYR